VADVLPFSSHTFTTIRPSFTTQNTTFCAPNFAKTLQKTRNHHAEKNPRGNEFKACK
jgi:hypothetical protein